MLIKKVCNEIKLDFMLIHDAPRLLCPLPVSESRKAAAKLRFFFALCVRVQVFSYLFKQL
jgi:hypothetical protein